MPARARSTHNALVVRSEKRALMYMEKAGVPPAAWSWAALGGLAFCFVGRV